MYKRQHVNEIKKFAKEEGSEVVVISADIEQQLTGLSDEDRQEFLEEMGLKESGLNTLIRSGYSLLGLISFLTTGEQETRAWTIKKGTKAVDAAGKIHTDISRGFIRAETISFDELVKHGSMLHAKEKGAVRLAVSYTHLDVYKRQTSICVNSTYIHYKWIH